ncbi:hypothetical protein GS610_12905 [Ruegeria sp. HKCCD6228]|uniref:Uncharacterized protein n=1 Tax=Ruegeria atlantica TaxID=81569 RepID=A0AA90Z2D4_9RHOB|nr:MULTISPECIES: hypothetical protein [Ruegeria]NOC83448.1 hypothetical protein [Ruegeria sp. HKCCD6428]NOD98106.1 hypothetical protein [Ruegeria sp. HKCCD6228]NOE19416.1 hypothetical protein [Ruegeria atlantica]
MVKVFKKIAIYFYGVLELVPVSASQLLIIKAQLIKFWPSTARDLGHWRPEPKECPVHPQDCLLTQTKALARRRTAIFDDRCGEQGRQPTEISSTRALCGEDIDNPPSARAVFHLDRNW